MSLLRYGFTVSNKDAGQEVQEVSDESTPTVAAHLPTREDTTLGEVEYNEASVAIVDLSDPTEEPRKKRGKYASFSGEDRAKIGKYANELGNKKAIEHFANDYPGLKESTVRTFKKAYIAQLSSRQKQGNIQPVTSLDTSKRGRPPTLFELDSKLVSFLKTLRSRGGVVNGQVLTAAAMALIKSNPSLHRHSEAFQPTRGWIQSIYRRCNFSRRAGTTTRPPVPRGLFEECKLTFLTDINNCIKRYSIPPALVLNADQTPSSYVSVGKMTMAERNAKSVPIKGLTDKRNITITFTVSLAGDFLPMQIIYQGKTKLSLPRNFKFPEGFSVTQNPKHYSNEAETIKLLNEVIHPYLVRKRKELKLSKTQKALLVWDVFKGQKTPKVISHLASLNIEVVSVPANMTHFFQPLDLSVNGPAKKFCKDKFTAWYSTEVQRQIESGKSIEDVDIDLRLSVLKPVHATWLVELYNYLTSTEGRVYIHKGWEKAGIKDVVSGEKVMPPLDPYHSIYATCIQ